MREMRRSWTAAVLALAVLTLTGCQGVEKTQAAGNNDSRSLWQKITREPVQITIPDGTRLAVRLIDTLSSSSSESGQSFRATLAQPIVVRNQVVIPEGAEVTGRVVAARPSGHLKTPAELALTLTSISVNGNTYDITTSTYMRHGASHKKRDLAWIGGSSAGGALLGALLGGGKGAAIGAGVGAGGGTAAAYTTGKKNIVLPSESIISCELREPLTVAK